MRTATLEHVRQSTSNELLTTGEAARLLGVSRQTIVNLADRGDLPCETTGTRRRIRRAEVARVKASQGRMTRDQRRSLWLGALIAGKDVRDPDRAVRLARENLARMRTTNPRGLARRWLGECLEEPVEEDLGLPLLVAGQVLPAPSREVG